VSSRRRPDRPAALGDERTDARERALLLLYEAHTKGVSPRATLAAQVVAPDPLACELVEGVEDHQVQLDEAISKRAKGWTIARMPIIDVMVMRIAGFELLGRPGVPVAVVLDEAIELAKRFSTDDSGRFVNGMLATIAPLVRPPA